MTKKRFLVLSALFIQISLICSSFNLNPAMPKILTAMGQNGAGSSNESSTPLIVVTSITQSPARIVPGDAFSETFILTNAGDGEARMVQLSVSISYPFAVMETSSNVFVGNLQPGAYTPPIVMQLSADKDALVGVYSIPFTIQYKNSTGGSYVELGTFGVQIFGEPQLQIDSIVIDPSSLTPGQNGLMTVRLTNVGTDVAVDATMRILGGKGIVSSPLAYVAKIDSKNSESILFPISVDGGLEPAVYLLNLTVIYRDRSNSTYHLSKFFEFKVLSSRPFIPQFYLAMIIGGVLVILIGYFIYAWKSEELSHTSSRKMGSGREQKQGQT